MSFIFSFLALLGIFGLWERRHDGLAVRSCLEEELFLRWILSFLSRNRLLLALLILLEGAGKRDLLSLSINSHWLAVGLQQMECLSRFFYKKIWMSSNG